MRNKNISFQLSIYFLISGIILSVFIILFGYYYVRYSFIENYRYRLQYDVQEVLDKAKNSMDEVVRFTESLESDFRQGYLKKNPHKYIEMVFKGQTNMRSFGVVNDGPGSREQVIGFMLSRSGTAVNADTVRFFSNDATQNDWIQKMSHASKPEWSAPSYNSETGSREITYARPFNYMQNGKFLHTTFFCTLSLDQSFGELKHQKMIKSGFSVILDRQNLIVYYPDSTKTGKNVNSVLKFFGKSQFEIHKLLQERISGYQNIHSNDLNDDGKMAIYWPVKSTEWFMITVIPESLILEEPKRMTIFLILLILFIGSITTAVTIYLSTKSDLKVLSDSMEQMKERLAIYRKKSLQSSLDKEAMDKELMLARDIEMNMVPTKFPLFPGRTDFDCFGRLIPAKIVGGDLFDIFLLNDNQLFISISDTLGKGIPAAMFSVITRTFIRSIANPITRLGKIMESLNNELSRGLESDMFATVLLGKLNLVTGEFIYCNAGHPHPFILRNDHTEEILTQSHGIPVGVKSNLQFSESRTVLAPAESLLTFTDGITEEYNEKGEFFGSERLISVVKPFSELSPQIMVNKTLDVLAKFRGRADAHDDQTLVAIKFTPN